jgi:hypothetical protein
VAVGEEVSDELVPRLRKIATQTDDSTATEAADRIEELEAVVRLGVEMRRRQRFYFKERSQPALIASKKAEMTFDEDARIVLEGKMS